MKPRMHFYEAGCCRENHAPGARWRKGYLLVGDRSATRTHLWTRDEAGGIAASRGAVAVLHSTRNGAAAAVISDERRAAGTCRHCGGLLPCWSAFGDARVGVRYSARIRKAAR